MVSFPKWIFGPAKSSGRKTPWTADVVPVPEGAGEPVGIARIDVRGEGRARVRYRINGGDEQTAEVQLPWMLDYPVFPEALTSVTADAGIQKLIASITMKGMILAYENTAHPTVTYSHWG